MSKFIIICSIVLMLAASASAGAVIVACPKPNQITFTKVNGKWYHYSARANARILSGVAAPIPMDGEGYINRATGFVFADFHRGDVKGFNDLICEYTGYAPDGKAGQVTMSEMHYTPTLSNCHFKTGDKYSCEGSVDSCQLECNF